MSLCFAILCTGAVETAAAAGCPNEAIREQEHATALPECRAYEQVSPVEKNGNNIALAFPGEIAEDGEQEGLPINQSSAVFSDASGSNVAFTSLAAMPETGARGAFFGIYAARRSAIGWQTASMSPPDFPNYLLSVIEVLGATPDLSKQLVTTAAALAPGAVAGNWNMYVQDTSTDTYELVATLPEENTSFVNVAFAGVSPSGSRWYFALGTHNLESEPVPANPQTGNNSQYNLYEFSNGHLRLVGVLPDGTASPEGSQQAAGASHVLGSEIARHQVSDDGEQVYWSSSDAEEVSSATGINPDETRIYLYRNGHSTLVSKREDGSAGRGLFEHATPDGAHALIWSKEALTSGAAPASLYRYDVVSEELTDLTTSAGEAPRVREDGVLGLSNDASYVYFQASGVLAPGGTFGEANLYVWHAGAIRFIGSSPSSVVVTDFTDFRLPESRVSPDGRYLAFISRGPLAGSQPQPETSKPQAYLYDYASDTLECVSCP
ncbi:MAG: hypothetical protein ACTHKT_14435, partial [Solirubrobacterales bacterium]